MCIDTTENTCMRNADYVVLKRSSVFVVVLFIHTREMSYSRGHTK